MWHKTFLLDIPLLIITVLLATTLTSYFLGLIPYPFGVIILSLFLAGRVLMLKNKP